MSFSTEVPRHHPVLERSASSVARALLRRSSSMNKRSSGLYASHMTTGVRKFPSQLDSHKVNGDLPVEDHSKATDGHENNSKSCDSHMSSSKSCENHVSNSKSCDNHTSSSMSCDNHVINGNATDEGESTAEEEVTASVDSSTTDNFPDTINPIDFIESNPRFMHPHTSHHPHSVVQVVGSGKSGHRYENWSMLVTERELEELARRNKIVSKRTKPIRGGKIDRQRPPHPLPRLAKVKPVRTITAPRKRRLSGRLARPPQLSNASEEGDMAQADEMGEGEGRDDGFVDCGDPVRKRNRKKPGGIHMLLPNGSPQSSPSNTPVSRRRASARKSRPKPRIKKPSKLAQHASADISTQESTTQGPGSTDSSEEGVSPHEGAAPRLNEDIADSDSEDLYEDTRSVTPNPREPPSSNSLSVSNHRDSPTAMSEKVVPQLDRVADVSVPSPILQISSKDSMHSNSDENIHDSNETSDTDFLHERQWTNRRFESDLSTAPFSSETSDMDTSGNERILSADWIGPSKTGISPYQVGISPRVEHRQINSESSGDENARRARDVKILPRPPPKSVVPLSGQGTKPSPSKAPPPAKKPLHLTKSSPMGKIALTPAQAKPANVPTRNRVSVKGNVPAKPKPPVAAKPKPEVKPKPPTSQTRSQSTPNGILLTGQPIVANGDVSRTKTALSPLSLRKIHSENEIKKPPVVAIRPHRVSEPQRAGGKREWGTPSNPPQPPVKPSVSPKPVERTKHIPVSQASQTSLSPSITSAGSEDTSKNSSSSSETLSSKSPSNSPHLSPAIKKKQLPQNRSSSPCLLSSKLPHTLDHSQSYPLLPSKPAPPKPPKDVEKREIVMKTRGQPTPDSSSTTESPLMKERSHSDTLANNCSQSDPVVPLTNGIQSPSPPPVPPRVRDSQIDLDLKDRKTPSPVMNHRRQPPQPPNEREESTPSPIPRQRSKVIDPQKRSKVVEPEERSKVTEEAPPVPPHTGKRSSIYSSVLNSTQIDTIRENYEVCDVSPELPIEEYYSRDTTQPAVSTPEGPTYAQINKSSTSTSMGAESVGQYSSHSKQRKKTSTARRTPPRPPVPADEQRAEIKEANEGAPPPLPSGPIPRRNRPTSQPALIENSVTTPAAQESPRSPSRTYQRARRNYEEIDIFEDWPDTKASSEKTSEEPLTLEKPVYKDTKTIIKPVRRDYEEIDIFDEPPGGLYGDVPKPREITPPKEPETPVSPIQMVAVTRQTSASTLKFNSTAKIPSLPIEDLRENWVPQFSSPQLPRRQAKSFSAKRGQSMVCRRSSSDRFMANKVMTMDPSLGRNGLHRTSSLDNLNDRMERSIRNSIHREVSSSEDDETNVLSLTNTDYCFLHEVTIDLPKTPSGDIPYSSPKTATSPSKERQLPDKNTQQSFDVNPDTEPLYQYINTAEFLREQPSAEGDKGNVYANSRGKQSQLEVARQLSQRRLWCEQPEVISSGVLNVLSEEERKLQEAIFEVIISEATYLRSLDVLIKHFMEDPGMNPHLPEGRRVMDKRQHHVIFSNVREVREVSGRFLEELQKRQRESAVVRNISDIVLNYADNHFDCYVSYCTNQVYQTREMQDNLENNVMFREYLKRLEKDKICQNLNMQSFLLLPMQRITRLPLLVLAILNRTPLDHPDHHIVERTLRTVQKLVTSCNDGARKMERTEQLVDIHKRLEFGKLKPFPLVSASRQLERKGILVELQVEQKLLGKIKVKRNNLYVFVFTDYVIITKKKKDAKGENAYKVIDHASRALVEVEWIETHHGVNFERQMFGEAESVSRATWAVSQAGAKHAFLVILLANAYQQCAKYLFLAQNDTDKTRWMESMERQDVQKDEEKIYQMWDCPQVQAIFDYRGQQPDELDLQRGDVVKVYRKMADGWYEGERLRDLRRGWFPSNFCVEIENEHTRARNLRETHRLRDLTESLQSRIQGIKP